MPVKFETKKVPMETLGEYLSEIRLQFNFTLEEVAQKTGLYEKFIYYIEQGKYQLLPPDVYVLGFLKKLATVYKISCRIL
jgi:cytoskeletal protein RodZ